MADKRLQNSGGISISELNLLKNEGKTVTVASNQANSSLRTLHDWFHSNAHISESDATGTGQSDVKLSEFYKAQVLECTFYGVSETPSGYGDSNNGYIYFVIDEDCLVRIGGDYTVNYGTDTSSWTTIFNNNTATVGSSINGATTRTFYVRDGNTNAYIGHTVTVGYGAGTDTNDVQRTDADYSGQQ